MTSILKTILIGGAAAAAFAAPASAAIIVTSTSANNGTEAVDPGFAALGQTLIYDFDTVSPPTGALFGDYAIATAPGTQDISAAPSGTAAGTNYLTVPQSGPTGTATLYLDGFYSSVSFYWGSIDSYNTIEVLDAVGNVLYSTPGNGLPMPVLAVGDQESQLGNRRVNFTADAGEAIAGFRMTSGSYAFETDSFAGTAAVPEPASWAMMIAGFGLVGAGMRRRAARPTLAVA